MKLLVCIVAMVLISNTALAQNTGINTVSPTAKVDVNGDLRIATLPVGVATTDLVLVVDATGNIKKVTLCDLQNATYGDIKESRLTTDHCGWYLLNGRAINTLSAKAQANATALGLGANLPNFTNRFTRTKQGAETLATTGGAATVTLNPANMPNFNMNITAFTAGDHSHSVVDRNQYNPGGTAGFANVLNGGDINSRADNATTNTLYTAGSHTHPFTISSYGGGGSFPLVPPYIQYASFVYLGK